MSIPKLPNDLIQRLVAIDAELTSWFLANRISDDFGSHPSELAYCDLSNSITDLVLDEHVGNAELVRTLANWNCLKSKKSTLWDEPEV